MAQLRRRQRAKRNCPDWFGNWGFGFVRVGSDSLSGLPLRRWRVALPGDLSFGQRANHARHHMPIGRLSGY